MWLLYVDNIDAVENLPALRLASGEWVLFFSSEEAALEFRAANGVIDPPVMAEVVR